MRKILLFCVALLLLILVTGCSSGDSAESPSPNEEVENSAEASKGQPPEVSPSPEASKEANTSGIIEFKGLLIPQDSRFKYSESETGNGLNVVFEENVASAAVAYTDISSLGDNRSGFPKYTLLKLIEDAGATAEVEDVSVNGFTGWTSTFTLGSGSDIRAVSCVALADVDANSCYLFTFIFYPSADTSEDSTFYSNAFSDLVESIELDPK